MECMDTYKADAVMLTGCYSTVEEESIELHESLSTNGRHGLASRRTSKQYGVHMLRWRQRDDIYGNICTTHVLPMVRYHDTLSSPNLGSRLRRGYMPACPGTQYAPGRFIRTHVDTRPGMASSKSQASFGVRLQFSWTGRTLRINRSS